VTDAEVEVVRLIGDVLAAGAQVVEHVRDLAPNARLSSNPVWLELSRQSMAAQERLARSLVETENGLAAGEVDAIRAALAYLEADPYYFRSGYARCRLAGRLSRVRLPEPEAVRARALVLDVVDGRRHCGQPGLRRLAAAVADNGLRRALRRRLHSPDPALARRALHTISCVRHPGLDRGDIEAARSLVLQDIGASPFLSPSLDRIARWLWTPDWQRDLRRTALHHGPDRNGAKRSESSKPSSAGSSCGRAPDAARQQRSRRSPGPCSA
jgi:hypothetical protein